MTCVDSEDKNDDKTYWTQDPSVCIQPASLCPQFADIGCGAVVVVVVVGWRGWLVAGASFYLGPAPAADRLGDSSRHTQQLGFSRNHVYHNV